VFLLSLTMPLTGLVPLKMLPFDNKNELSVMVDMPEGTPLDRTDAVIRALATELQQVPEVVAILGYTGIPAPIDFNGLVRHYFLRRAPELGALHITLADKSEREQQSHTIGLRIRDRLTAVAAEHGANVALVEVPPGPPVLSTVVAEITGPPGATTEELQAGAEHAAELLASIPGVVDLDTTNAHPYEQLAFVTDKEKAALNGISTAMLANTLRTAMSGQTVGAVHIPGERRLRDIVLRVARSQRSGENELLRLSLRGVDGPLVHVSELGGFEQRLTEPVRFRKNLEPLAFVLCEVA